ncbi:MAG: cytochrome c [Saprospiraceae bacterium]|jgi:mono/diheme cytochrome c family protein|nr:cytochrome c [Saprospiraceae bacterium]
MNSLNCLYGLAVIGFLGFLSSCQSPGGNTTGSEYMPDMAHSVAYEANVFGYYYNNRWGSEEDLHKMVQPRKPVSGTIARGYAGGIDAHETGRGVAYKKNGSVPYYYGDTEEERLRAIAEIINNPYPITTAGLERGKALYTIQCAICHGEKGDGAGYLVRDDGGKYPVQPANFLLDDLINSSNGRYYHTLIYGRNLMGGYSDKLSYEERWNVIQYIRSLQAVNKKLEYNEKLNTFNTTDVPYSVVAQKMLQEQAVVAAMDTTASPSVHTSGGH